MAALQPAESRTSPDAAPPRSPPADGALRLGIFGRGRLAQAVAALARRQPDIELAWSLGRDGAPTSPVDVVLDASAAEALPAHLAWADAEGVDFVIATTGWDQALASAWSAGPAASRHGLLVAPNFSLGVAFLRRASLALGRLAALDADSDLSILERHHRAKADAPSGTAKLLAGALAEGCPRYSGWAQGRAEAGRVMIASLRAGLETGYHEIRLQTGTETIVLSHDSGSREPFARGALLALRWIRGRKGLHSFDEVAAPLLDGIFGENRGGSHA
jgi:4-hydroxy-tetrahydrodipicolinate reductase